MILFDVTIEAKDDRRKEATGLLRRTMAGSQAEEGCLIYRFTADLDDPRLFHLVELWESEAAFAGHATGATFRNFLAELPLGGRVGRSVARPGQLSTAERRRGDESVRQWETRGTPRHEKKQK